VVFNFAFISVHPDAGSDGDDAPAPSLHTLRLYDTPLADIGAYRVRSALFDGGVLVAVAAYLAAVHRAAGWLISGAL
jgi:hypothetical protein